MDEQERVALELRLEDRLRADLGGLPVRAYVYYKSGAMVRSHRTVLQRAFSFAGAVAVVVAAIVLAVAAAALIRDIRSPVPASAPTPPPATRTETATPSNLATPSPTSTPTPVPTPADFALPSNCSYVGSPSVSTDFSRWHFDCGTAANRDARGTLSPAFTAQGWTLCGVATANAAWSKGGVALTVSESSGSPGDYPTISQSSRAAAGCP
jgi:hypothetical protein